MKDDIDRLNFINEMMQGVEVRLEQTRQGYAVWIGRVEMPRKLTLRLALDSAMDLMALEPFQRRVWSQLHPGHDDAHT